MKNESTILSLWKELDAMPEHQTLEKIRNFSISIEIFDGNYKELIHHLQVHNNPRVSLDLMRMDKRHLLHAYQKEITRFLHNYIASALSLTDHARNHYRDLYSSNNLFPDYQDEINRRFVSNPLAVFIKDLRQYFQHYKMPGLSSNLTFTKGAPDFVIKLLLPLKEITKFSGWSQHSKKNLAQQTSDLDLFALINDYHQLIENFYRWFIDRQMEIHKGDIKKVNEHKDKIRGLAIMDFLKQFMVQPKTIDEFENEIFRYFPEEELEEIKNTVTKAERVERILHLLKQISKLNKDAMEKIRASYAIDENNNWR